MGRLVYSDEIELQNKVRKTMHLEHLSNGVYFIRLKTDNNILTTKFVVE